MAKPTTAPSEPMSTITASKAVAMVDAIDVVHSNILKLHAMLHCTYGESGDSFRNLSDNHQDSFLWACCDIAHDIQTALESSFSDEVQP